MMINTGNSHANACLKAGRKSNFIIAVFFINKYLILILLLLLSIFNNIVYSRGLKPTSHAKAEDRSYAPKMPVWFYGGLSHDNDSQTRSFMQRWVWDFDYDFETQRFTPDTITISPWVSHTYSEPNYYEVAVKYIDDDGVEGDIYTFRIEIKTVKRYYYVKDHLGSIRQTIDDNGVVVEKQDYSSYGAILQGRSMNIASSNEKYKFTEKERDKESGLDYFGARYYDSEIGRWLSVDPLADKYPGWSPYNYCANNPINAIDPNGMDCFFYQAQGEKESSWYYQKGKTAKYTDVNGNEQETSNGYEYLIKFTITGENDEGAAVGILEMGDQDRKLTYGEENIDYLDAFSGNHIKPHIGYGNWFMDLSERPTPCWTKAKGIKLCSIRKGIQYFPDGKYGNHFPGLDWGRGRIRLNYGSPEDDGQNIYLHEKFKLIIIPAVV